MMTCWRPSKVYAKYTHACTVQHPSTRVKYGVGNTGGNISSSTSTPFFGPSYRHRGTRYFLLGTAMKFFFWSDQKFREKYFLEVDAGDLRIYISRIFQF